MEQLFTAMYTAYTAWGKYEVFWLCGINVVLILSTFMLAFKLSGNNKERQRLRLRNAELEALLQAGDAALAEQVQSEKKRAAPTKEKEKLEGKLRKARKMEAVGLMAGGVAHDLNNILSVIIHYPERLLRNLPLDSPSRPSIEAIHSSGLQAAALVADLLTAAKGVAAVKETVDLNKLVLDTLALPEWRDSLIEKPGISLRTNLASESITVHGSPSHIRQCLLNLLNNGCDAVYQAGKVGTITVSTGTGANNSAGATIAQFQDKWGEAVPASA